MKARSAIYRPEAPSTGQKSQKYQT